jgi:sterol desaturase/sphingolipid hydroxylase (fatty acid hydroxylase superfamily)
MKEFFFYIVYYDIFYYFLHRLLHTKYLYNIHKIHHKKNIPNYLDYYNIHLLEYPLTSIGLLIAIYIYKIYIYQLIMAIIFINTRGILIHDKKFINLVGDHHLIHHKYYKYNYGEYWLDFTFGTIYKKKLILLSIIIV